MPVLSRVVGALPATVPFVPPEALERRADRSLTLRLGANESAFGPSARAIAALADAAPRVSWYGDPEGFELRHALAGHHGVAADAIVLGSGIDELLGLIVRAHMNPGDTAVMSAGAYPTFAYHVIGYGGVLERPAYGTAGDTAHYHNDWQALADAAHRTAARLVYLSNPDNPTGSWLDGDAVLALLDALPPGTLLVLDEAYAEFAPAEALPILAADDPRVIRLRTFSKAHGLAGLRVGYAIGAVPLIATFDKIRNHFGMTRLALAAALASLGDVDHVAGVVEAVAAGRRELAALAAHHGLDALPSATNFVAMDLGDSTRAKAVLAALLEREGVFIRTPGVAPLDRLIRVTVGTPPERTAFAEAFGRVLETV